MVFVSDLCNHFLNEFAFVGESSERFFVDICLENLLDFVHALVVEGNLIADGLKFFIQNFKCTGQTVQFALDIHRRFVVGLVTETMFNLSPCMLQDGSQLNLKSDILVLLVFYKLAAFVCEFHNHMDRVITEFNAVVLAFFTFIDNLTDFKSVFQQLKNAFYIRFKKSQNTTSENIRDIFKMLIFVLGDNFVAKGLLRLDSEGHSRNLDVVGFDQCIDNIFHIMLHFFIDINVLIIFTHNGI